jgi:hypothetical protein
MGMISGILVYDALAVSSLVLLALLAVLPFVTRDEQRGR